MSGLEKAARLVLISDPANNRHIADDGDDR